MQVCSYCQSKQLDGTIFCSECGASMFPKSRRETTMSLGQRDAGEPAPAPVVVAAPEPARASPSIAFVIMNSGRRITIALNEEALIGRKDNARGIYPDLDLGLDGGYDAGVSRRHAILAYKEGVYTVEDLGSSNGTFVNGQRLAPQQPAQLRHGDELRCATLLMRVELP